MGPIPEYKYWIIDETQFKELEEQLSHTLWSGAVLLPLEGDTTISYCLADCKALCQILVKFNELIFNEFKVNIPPTIPPSVR